jgi:hypothetical protein
MLNLIAVLVIAFLGWLLGWATGYVIEFRGGRPLLERPGRTMKQELFSLEGRTAHITGGNGGLGRAIAIGMREAGAQVAVTGRKPEKNEAIGQELGDPTAVFVLDVRDEAAVEHTMTQVIALDVWMFSSGFGLCHGSTVAGRW